MLPRKGDFGVVKTNGWAGRLIRFGTRSSVNHAVLVIDDMGAIVQGDPHGAAGGNVTDYPVAIWSTELLTPQERDDIAAYGLRHMGVPYSWLDCAEIGWVDTRMRLPSWLRWLFPVPFPLRRDLARDNRLMCSALVDSAYSAAGVHLFNDGRPFGGVSPGDLLDVIEGKVK